MIQLWNNSKTKYIVFFISLIAWSIVALRLLGTLKIGLIGIPIILGLIYIPFCRWVLKILWINTLWFSFVISSLSLCCTIALIDFGVYYYPNDMFMEIRPTFVPIFERLTFINNEYDFADFMLLVRVIVNAIISMLLFELTRIVKNKYKSSQHAYKPNAAN
jgi:hypothetical protein